MIARKTYCILPSLHLFGSIYHAHQTERYQVMFAC